MTVSYASIIPGLLPIRNTRVVLYKLGNIQALMTIDLLIALTMGFLLATILAMVVIYRLMSKYTISIQEEKSNADELKAEFVGVNRELEIRVESLKTELRLVRSSNVEYQNKQKKFVAQRENFLQKESRMQEQLALLASEKEMIELAKKEIVKEFELSASKLFEQKQAQFTQSSKQNIESVLTPFKSQLADFNKRVEDIYHKENTERGQLLGQILELQKQTQKVSGEANNLASALKGDNRLQGAWGEIILERLLEQSGLVKGREYEIQESFKNTEGKRFRPDVIVHLPENKDIVIDSKVSLLDFEKSCNAESTEEQTAALKNHIDSIRSHVKGISKKQYENLEGIRTLDFIFVFVPVEAAYVSAMQASPTLFKEAHDRNVVIVSPSSLMVALKTVETIWRYEKQNANAEEIASSAGKLYDQFVLFAESLEDVGRFVEKAADAYGVSVKRLSTGRGNLLKRVDDLKQLGAKSNRKMPAKYQTSIEQQEDLIEVLSGGDSEVGFVASSPSSSDESV